MIVNSVQPWHILLQSAGICWDTAYWLVIKTILKNHPSGVPLWWLQLPRMSQKNGACCTGWTLIWHVGHWTGKKNTDIHFLPAFLNIQLQIGKLNCPNQGTSDDVHPKQFLESAHLTRPPAPTSEACGTEAHCPALYSAVPCFARRLRSSADGGVHQIFRGGFDRDDDRFWYT